MSWRKVENRSIRRNSSSGRGENEIEKPYETRMEPGPHWWNGVISTLRLLSLAQQKGGCGVSQNLLGFLSFTTFGCCLKVDISLHEKKM